MTHYASCEDGSLSQEERTFLRGRAEGFGMFISAATLVHKSGKAFSRQPHAIGDEDLPSLTEVDNIIKAQGAKAILQIHHGGYQSVADLIGDLSVVAPSAIHGARALQVHEDSAVLFATEQSAHR